MELIFVKQQIPEAITELDEIVLYNCDEDMMNGPHTVAIVREDGEVTLVGSGPNEGTITVIFLGEDEE